jgi:hypothetical protein
MAGRAVAILTGLILLFASLMKELALADTTISQPWPSIDWRLSLAASVFELFLGVWLIAGIFPTTVRRVALVCFLGFAGVALFKAIRGEVSCGCFGGIAVAPWLVFVLDVAIVSALLRFPPVASNRPVDGVRIRLASGVVVLAVAFGVGAGWGRDGRMPLRAVPDRIDLGEVRQGGIASGQLELVNDGRAPVQMASFRSSCPCLTATLPEWELMPGETTVVQLLLDMSREPQFTGRLGIELRGVSAGSQSEAFRVVVKARVE